MTLLEVLIVVVIVVIVVIVAVSVVRGTAQQRDDRACQADRRALEAAAEAHYANEGEYPATEQDLVDAGFLSAVSSWHRYAAGTPSEAAGAIATYTVEPVEGGRCA